MSPCAVLEKMGSISFGCSLVAGNRRVPKPAAGIMTLRITGVLSVSLFYVNPYILNVCKDCFTNIYVKV